MRHNRTMPSWPRRTRSTRPAPSLEIQDARSLRAADIRSFCLRSPVEAALLGEHVEALGRYAFYGDQLWCLVDGGRLEGLCWTGGNVVPYRLPPGGAELVADRLRTRRRRYSSIVGPAEDVLGLWALLEGSAPPPRDVRADQPSLTITGAPLVAPNPQVRLSDRADLDVLLRACVAMFTEEVGYSPLDSGSGYERRVRSLVESGRSLSWVADTDYGREVIFKAELGTVALGVTQVQGVWVNPRYRGRGYAAAGMAAVVEYAQRHVAPVVSLYVNAYNTPALAVYRKVGFHQVGTFATILF